MHPSQRRRRIEGAGAQLQHDPEDRLLRQLSVSAEHELYRVHIRGETGSERFRRRCRDVMRRLIP